MPLSSKGSEIMAALKNGGRISGVDYGGAQIRTSRRAAGRDQEDDELPEEILEELCRHAEEALDCPASMVDALRQRLGVGDEGTVPRVNEEMFPPPTAQDRALMALDGCKQRSFEAAWPEAFRIKRL